MVLIKSSCTNMSVHTTEPSGATFNSYQEVVVVLKQGL